MHTVTNQLEAAGVAIVEHVLDEATVVRLLTELDALPNDPRSTRRRGSLPFARRNLLSFPFIAELARSAALRGLIEPILGTSARPIRGILFDKTPEANWLVPWHQDLSIAVARRIDVPGFGPWSEKAGVVHVQPPLEVLRDMITIRLHLDDCFSNNGPLRVVAGTHHDLLSPELLTSRLSDGPVLVCCVPRGGAVVMRPMILHSSLPAQVPGRRRVVHIEFAGCDLPGGLQWHEQVGVRVNR